jgi:SAM-dependent methyltransferase
MREIRTIELPPARNTFYHFAGFGILVLNKIRHSLQGYRSPRPFPISEIDRAIDYDISVVDHWTQMLSEYVGHPVSLEGRTILELGPGADLGVGLITLSRGARKYNALDVNNLIATVPESFYEALFQVMRKNGTSAEQIGTLRSQLKSTSAGSNERLNYVVRDDFDISVFAEEGVDTVFSQAAFEHFDDIEKTFEQLTRTVRRGTVLIAEIDLNTHTRWIRDIDPLNIYRYSDLTYNLFRFAGSPNRLRPGDYAQALRQHGWENVQIKPLVRVGDQYLDQVRPRLAPRFRSSSAEVEYLSVMLCATKP